MTNNDIKMPKNAEKLICDFCNFKCFKLSNYTKHLLTLKHKNNDKKMTNNDKKMPKNAEISNTFTCICGNSYKYRQGLHSHKKKCLTVNEKINNKEDTNGKELIFKLLQQNNQLQNQIFEMCKEKTITNINNTGAHINSHNKAFNLQFFLNETCKDAMNIMDFIDSIKLQLSDLENVGKLGYVEGISNIITTNLKALDITQRPIHCADKKREVIYIKDENKWEKEDDQKNKLKKVIHRVACKNQRLIPKFKEEHPDCLKSSSKFSDQYNKIIVESMGGSGDNDKEKEIKIIKNISKQVLIDK